MHYILLFFPSLISLDIEYKKDNRKINIIEFLTSYGTYNVIVNMITLFVTSIFKKGEAFILNNDNLSTTFSYKYLLVAITIAIILPILKNLIKQVVDIKIEVKKHNETQNKINI